MIKTDSGLPAHRPPSQRNSFLSCRASAAPRLLVLLAACLGATTASARLGGTSQALAAEKAALRVNAERVEHRALYDVHHLQREDGEIRQYSDHAGHVFAVAWKTRLPVPLADLLEASATPSTAPVRVPLVDQVVAGRHSASAVSDDRVVHVLKLAHLFMGSARLASKTPQGVDPKELR